jgi:hypothetical protein
MISSIFFSGYLTVRYLEHLPGHGFFNGTEVLQLLPTVQWTGAHMVHRYGGETGRPESDDIYICDPLYLPLCLSYGKYIIYNIYICIYTHTHNIYICIYIDIYMYYIRIYIYNTYTFAMIPQQDILTFGSFEGPSPTLVGASPVTWSFPFHFSLKAK